ncbi:LytS/YhcK type 5TM receptor domain-containing protein [Bacillus sp. FJAT-22090]|uniref:LytS/YhcK type 5TM receptor domain-containing protein n=1 Tax=Bacillus sp. FJAT-22090 TaxID=1581038 RepID=UPI0021B366A4|nr:LytS/YhcK type 5TM receptor domain-containing protein [Bacillus sp. FJAT-22090]
MTLIERLAIIVTIAFLLTRFKFFRKLFDYHTIMSTKQRIALTLVFGLFGIIGTYTGIIVNPLDQTEDRWTRVLTSEEALANSRVLGIVIGGLLGGFRIGFGAGIIAGVHRFFLGGFTAIACGLATIIAGFIAGLIGNKLRKQTRISPWTALIVGGIAEAIQMLVILLVADPYPLALALVKEIMLPMVVTNAIGSALFILIIRNVLQDDERTEANGAQKALQIAESTLDHLRAGLTYTSANKVCEIIFSKTSSLAVSMTDKDTILAHVGSESSHHISGSPIQTESTRQVIRLGELQTIGREEILCNHVNCSLGAAIIAPIKIKNETVATLKIYVQNENLITPSLVELVQGLSSMFGHQLELSELDQLRELAKEAEIKALQAQVNPHFIFNAMNTIVSLIRTNPDRARSLLVTLANFIRQNVENSSSGLVTLSKEVELIQSYLLIEEARFGDRIHVKYSIDENVLGISIPSMAILTLVQNSFKHGLQKVTKNGLVEITIKDELDYISIFVRDNGQGIDDSRRLSLLHDKVESENGTGIGLYNLHMRLKKMIHQSDGLHIQSDITGTTIFFFVPKITIKQEVKRPS